MEIVPVPLQDALQFLNSTRGAEQVAETSARAMRDAVWMRLQELRLTSEVAAKSRIVTSNRSDPAHAEFDMIRTKVLQNLKPNGWTSIAITAPTRGCGTSLVAANLAFSLAHQKDCRTLLVDLDLKQPKIARLLGMKEPSSMEAFLNGDCDINEIFRRYGDNLAVAANSKPVRFSAELLQSNRAVKVLMDMQQAMGPNVILYDMTSMLDSDDVMAFLPSVDAAILVAAAEHSTFADVDACERSLADKTNMLGVVLNKCRYGRGY